MHHRDRHRGALPLRLREQRERAHEPVQRAGKHQRIGEVGNLPQETLRHLRPPAPTNGRTATDHPSEAYRRKITFRKNHPQEQHADRLFHRQLRIQILPIRRVRQSVGVPAGQPPADTIERSERQTAVHHP